MENVQGIVPHVTRDLNVQCARNKCMTVESEFADDTVARVTPPEVIDGKLARARPKLLIGRIWPLLGTSAMFSVQISAPGFQQTIYNG